MTREHLRNNKYLVDHLELVSKEKTKKCWRYPAKPDEHEVKLVQIIPCNIIGTWNMTSRKSTFEVDNWQIIEGLFQSLYDYDYKTV